MSNILVVYYSRSGHTRRAAQEIARACHADLDEITEDGDRRGIFGYLRSAVEALLGLEPKIRPMRHAPANYDLVIIGTPIWFWNIASPVRSYIRSRRGDLRRVALFCTMGGSGDEKVLRELKELCGRPALATLALAEADLATNEHQSMQSRFARTLLKETVGYRRPLVRQAA